MNIRNLVLALFCILSIQNLHASKSFICKSIQFQGLENVTQEEAKKYLTFNVHNVVTQNDIDDSIDRLYASEQFESVSVDVSDGVVTVTVREFPILSKINITGNNNVPEQVIKKILNSLGIYENGFLDRKKFIIFKEKLLAYYSEMLRKGTTIYLSVEDNWNQNSSTLGESVILNIFVLEDEPYKIKEINFHKNQEYTSSELASLLTCYEENFFKRRSFKDNYSFQNLIEDMKRIYFFYHSQGYVNCNITRSIVYSDDDKTVSINLDIYEGDQFYLTDFILDRGVPSFVKEDLHELLEKNINQIFDLNDIEYFQEFLFAKLSDLGYLNAEVHVNPLIDSDRNTVKLEIKVKTNQRCTVEEISFEGLKLFKPNYLLKNFLQKENTYINKKDILHDLEYLRSTGFFESVEFKLLPNPDQKNLFKLQYIVKEKNQNSVNGGVGLDENQNVDVHFQFNNTHALGIGNTVSLTVAKSVDKNSLKISFLNPRFCSDKCSSNINFFVETTNRILSSDKKDFLGIKNEYFNDTYNWIRKFLNIGGQKDLSMLNYEINESLGIHVSSNSNLNLSAGYSYHESRDTDKTLLNKKFPFKNFFYSDNSIKFLKSINENINLNAAYTFQESIDSPILDLNNNVFFSTNYIIPLNQDNNYFKFILNANKYFPIFLENNNFFLSIRTCSGLKIFQQNNELNNYDDFYASNNYFIRGYSLGAIGPKRVNSSNAEENKNLDLHDLKQTVGGNIFSINSVELVSPIPFLNIDYAKNFQVSTFVDFGNIWKLDLLSQQDNSELHYSNPKSIYGSYGLSLKWKSPFGMISFSYSLPIGKYDQKDLDSFQINFGT
ncbi:Outer membrane protein assembly factor BamA [Buchnera aphidicola (Chaetosiphella stipae setosa)]